MRAALVLSAMTTIVGCATAGSDVDFAASDATVDTRTGTDGSGGIDTTGVDGFLPPGDTPIFPVEEGGTCTGPTACLTKCGTLGTRACSGGVPAATCTPPIETCNGIDDDCNGDIDEKLERPCSTACGSGVETCDKGTWGGCTAKRPGKEICNGLDDDCNGKVDDLDCSHTVECSVFDDGYSSLVGPNDSIFVNGSKQSCVPGGASGTCRRWMGRCVAKAASDGHTHAVTFEVFNDGYTSATAGMDSVFVNGSSQMCIPGGSAGTCRKWFGRGKTDVVQGHSHDVVCSVFDDGYTNMLSGHDSIFFDGSKLCVPGGPSGQCRRWFGRCTTK